jgi:hypothetical protein
VTDQKTDRIVLFDHAVGHARLIVALHSLHVRAPREDTPPARPSTVLRYFVAHVSDVVGMIEDDELLEISKEDFHMLLDAGRAADLGIIASALDPDGSNSITSKIWDIGDALDPESELSFASKLLAALEER